MVNIKRGWLFVVWVAVLALIGGAYGLARPVYAASAGDVVINELNYNPGSDNDDDEFMELYNTTGSSIDLEGWCFTNGITLCFGAGTTLASHGYGVISRNAAQTLSTYGVATIATYTGKLDNGGERLTLVDGSSQIIADFTYDDAAPWPTAPDGTGPSLELKDPTYDYTQASSWGASIGGPTPGQVNSVHGLQLPIVQDFSVPVMPDTGESPLITIRAEQANSVELHYKVMFNPEQTVPMVDDGTNDDQTASDGIYSVRIPAQAAGSLVRVRVQATNADGTSSLPSNDDTMQYRSYIVDDGQTSDLPIVRWYIDPAVYDDLVTNHATDDTYVSAVVAVGEQIFDNAEVKVRGQSSTNYPKKKFTFDLPKGYSLGAPYFEHPVDKFSINAYFLNMTDLQEKLAWTALANYGFDGLQSQYVRVQKNDDSDTSKFFGHYLMTEGYDSEWRERTDHKSGALYKQYDDKKTREDEDNSDITAFRYGLENLQGQQLKDFILDNTDVPGLINYDALTTILGHQDWGFYKNMYQYRDTDGTGRWSVLPWDLDNALAMPIFKPESTPMYFSLDPLHANNQPSYTAQRLTENAMYQFPEFREMYYRRVATLYDQIYKSGQLLEWYTDLYDKSKDTIDEDLVEWKDEKAALLSMAFPTGIPWDFRDDFPFDITPEQAMSGETTAAAQDIMFRYGYGKFVETIESERAQGNLPQSQASTARIVVSEVQYDPAGGAQDQYIELYNPATTAVDISGWQLSGDVNMTFPQGAVIAAKGYAVVVKNDAQFREAYEGSQYVLGEYRGTLNDGDNQLVLKQRGDLVVTSFTYGTSAPWPTLGGGLSLSLVRTDGDMTNPYCWAPSLAVNGTPGAANELNQEWVVAYGHLCQPPQDASSPVDLAGTGDSPTIMMLIAVIAIMASTGIIRLLRSSPKSLILGR